MQNTQITLVRTKYEKNKKVCPYNIFQILEATSQVGAPVLLKFVMSRPEKTHLRTVSRVDASKFTFQTDLEYFSPPHHKNTHTLSHTHTVPIIDICVTTKPPIKSPFERCVLEIGASFSSWSEREAMRCLFIRGQL